MNQFRSILLFEASKCVSYYSFQKRKLAASDSAEQGLICHVVVEGACGLWSRFFLLAHQKSALSINYVFSQQN